MTAFSLAFLDCRNRCWSSYIFFSRADILAVGSAGSTADEIKPMCDNNLAVCSVSGLETPCGKMQQNQASQLRDSAAVSMHASWIIKLAHD